MKRALACLLPVLFMAALQARPSGQETATDDIDVTVILAPDGSAHIREVWSVVFMSGSEWYIDRSNQGDMEISNLAVSDDSGRAYINVGEWNVDRSLTYKDGKCGIITKKGGYELCWGPGSYGRHVFTVEYDMTGLVRAMDDYDALHVQFVGQGMKPLPGHAALRVEVPWAELSDRNSAVWAFGYEGTDGFSDGAVVAETTAPFASAANSMILLIRFDKGIFAPESVVAGPFGDKLERAFDGSAYQEYLDGQRRENIAAAVLMALLLAVLVIVIIAVRRSVIRRNLRMFGVRRLKEIGYVRTIPFNGNLIETSYVLSRCGREASGKDMAGAMILSMIKDGYLAVSDGPRGKVLISFTGKDTGSLTPSFRELYDMMKEASGDDGILQEKEFSRFSRRHSRRVSDWVSGIVPAGAEMLRADNYVSGMEFSTEGKMHARSAVGFKQYLEEFTIINERRSVEVALWRDYIIFASLYGIAKQVATELKDIDPKAFEASVGYDYPTMSRVLFFSDGMGSAMMSAVGGVHQSAISVGGGGGFASFGGGGGFSGGGFGGGAR